MNKGKPETTGDLPDPSQLHTDNPEHPVMGDPAVPLELQTENPEHPVIGDSAVPLELQTDNLGHPGMGDSAVPLELQTDNLGHPVMGDPAVPLELQTDNLGHPVMGDPAVPSELQTENLGHQIIMGDHAVPSEPHTDNLGHHTIMGHHAIPSEPHTDNPTPEIEGAYPGQSGVTTPADLIEQQIGNPGQQAKATILRDSEEIRTDLCKIFGYTMLVLFASSYWLQIRLICLAICVIIVLDSYANNRSMKNINGNETNSMRNTLRNAVSNSDEISSVVDQDMEENDRVEKLTIQIDDIKGNAREEVHPDPNYGRTQLQNEKIPGPSEAATAPDQKLAKQSTRESQPLQCFSENGHPLCQPSCDEREIRHREQGSLEAVNELETEVRELQAIFVLSYTDVITEGATSQDPMLEEPTHISQPQYFSENGHPLCQPSSDQRENFPGENNTYEAVLQPDNEAYDIQELIVSSSSCATDNDDDNDDGGDNAIHPRRFPVEWDDQNNFKLSRDVLKVIAQNPTKVFHLTPCSKVTKTEIEDPTDYLVDSGYNGTTGTTHSQQLEHSATSQVTGATRFQNQKDLPSRKQGITVPAEPPFSMPTIQLQSLGGTSSEPVYQVHKHQGNICLLTSSHRDNSPDQCDVLFVHQGYALFVLTMPRGVHVNTITKMRQFTQKICALLGEETYYFLQEGLKDRAEINEDCVINIVTLT
ncbi:uncharacterized protein LOC117329035 [Pecten maximus]|uniref:uncharacterized protein LOC117329035 n=1 Tax=Pecten maximus TaxID=6579 RepID=UPI0014589793|nr:uncharacterized protein LOC117329035 [Pecten maximus]